MVNYKSLEERILNTYDHEPEVAADVDDAEQDALRERDVLA
jgi:hypothetical protein